jgi:hypothetical protein
MIMRLLLLSGLLLLPLIAGCGASGAPTDPTSLRSTIGAELRLVATGIERGDGLLAAEPIDDAFRMGDNVAVRYQDGPWGNGSGEASFLQFLNNVFALHANIQLSLQLTDVQQSGDLATASVHVVWNSTRTDVVPPGHYTAENDDYFFFRRRPAGWLLLRWQETPLPPPPFDQ